jgi:hypothetical protein
LTRTAVEKRDWDTLADFLIREVGSFYDPEVDNEANLENAIEAVTKAKEQLEDVIQALKDALAIG